MEKLAKPYDKEYMRIAMLKHEETFKEQVYELHRLYRIQKMLMKNMEKSRGNELSQREWNLKIAIGSTQNDHNKSAQRKPQMKFDLEQPAEEHIAESDGDGVRDIMDETEIELTLGPSSYNRRKKVETPLTSDSGNSLSSSSTGSSHINKTSSLCQSGIRNSFDVEERPRQDRLKQPPWPFHVLSLNIT
ncbi:uncharacterized protein G2W53_019803 [Senna tora]|uniref:Uncharacterized protein n=1 Tax=Senna tora TaxID=362788 RepID=A0A834TVL5_9FABA|nr:uncharacterized protein G2W53_019803 [Senna tora]